MGETSVMCAEFLARYSPADIQGLLGIEVTNETVEASWDRHVKIYSSAPIVRARENHVAITEMRFSVKPPKTPYPTFNARLSGVDERTQKIIPIHDRPTWRKPLETKRCLVAMNAFIEPIYLGEHAGQAVEFHPEGDSLLFGAGIFDETVDSKTGEVYEGFALILHTPTDQVLEIGHHRMPVFLKPKDAVDWVLGGKWAAADAGGFLKKHRFLPVIDPQKNRDLAKGWAKRVGEHEEKLEKEKEYLRRLLRV